MLKKKIDRFTRKLGRLKVTESKGDITNTIKPDLKPTYFEEEAFIQEDDSPIIDFTADISDFADELNKIDEIPNTSHSIDEKTLLSNPKLAPTLLKSSDNKKAGLQQDEAFASSKAQNEENIFKGRQNLNHIPNNANKNIDDDHLHAPSNSKTAMPSSSILINETNSTNGM